MASRNEYIIAYQQRAIEEYEEAVSWYKERSTKAAEHFDIEVKNKINILRGEPTRFRKTYKDFREVKLNRYPFNIIYLVDEAKTIVVIASIYHNKRNPKKKYRKL